MKKLFFVFAFLFTGLASSHSWAQQVHYEWPTVSGLAINTVCATEDTFRTTTPTTYCAETKVTRYAVRNGGEVDFRRPLRDGEQPQPGEFLEEVTSCARYASEHREVPREVTVTKCVRYTQANEYYVGECLEWATRTVKAGLTYSVTKITSYPEADQMTFENYTIPMCN